jgi:uncharacterized protein (DUF2062 family)
VTEKTNTEAAAPREKPLARLGGWVAGMYTRLMTIQDTPHSIALGSAIGIFMGFTPLYGLKMLLSFGVAWLLKSNKIAAIIGVTLHDLILPFAPALHWWEYRVGYWIVHGYFPRRMGSQHVPLRDYAQWTTFFTVGQPMLVGSLMIGVPFGMLAYFVCRALVARARRIAPPSDGFVQ